MPEIDFVLKRREIAAPAQPFFSPLNILLIAAGLALLGYGSLILIRIQGGAEPGGFFSGLILFVAGIIVPCLGIPHLRNFLLPRNDPQDALDVEPAADTAKDSDAQKQD